MAWSTHQSVAASEVWALAQRQHGVATRGQLLALGLSVRAVEHRVARGRLHQIARGVYSVGRPEVTQYGKWMAAVLACGPLACLSHFGAAALWGIRPSQLIEVSIRSDTRRRRPGITIHRRPTLSEEEVTTHHEIPVTTPICTLVDLAARLPERELERAINQADILDLVHVADLREALDDLPPRPGSGALKNLIDRRTFRLTRSELEAIFIPLSVRAGFGVPLTRQWVNGFEVDFYWPGLGLVVETDGGRFHRTPSEQRADRRRDQAHLRAGLTPLRFTHGQVKFEPADVEATLATVARRLSSPSAPAGARRA
jgi:very-short-patch-repair endonuclease